MTDIGASRSRAPEVARIDPADVVVALRAGLQDFARAPAFGLLFGAVYVAIGVLIVGITILTGTTFYAVPITLGFPLVAPFAAVGLYEVSRRLQTGEALGWSPVLGVVWAERGRQLPWFGALMVTWFLMYLFISHTIFALMLGVGVLTDVTGSLAVYLTPRGLAMLAVQLVIGGIFAALLFTACVVSLPMMMDREVDFITAMITSFRAVTMNLGPMAVWAVLVVVVLAIGMAPLFLGLFVALPVLGHATWHLYRRVLPE